MANQDSMFLEAFLDPIRKCAEYKPAFGQGRSNGLSLADFKVLYGQDAFYSWLGLDNSLVYAAHKAAGGLTSVYRQIGVGSERLIRAVIMSTLNLESDQIDWEYEYEKPDGKKGVHTLDAKIDLSDLSINSKPVFESWLNEALDRVSSSNSNIAEPVGAAFEIRQGYKSADSKRQNADLRFGIRAYQVGLVPVFAILSTQISEPVIRRYRSDGMLVLTGIPKGDATVSTFAFFRDVIGFDLEDFFKRNSETLKAEVKAIIESLLATD